MREPLTYRLINKKTILQFKTQFQHTCWDPVLKNDDPQQAYTLFMREFTKHYNHSFPEKTKNMKREPLCKPWVSQGIIKSLKHKNKLYENIYIFNPTPINYEKYKRYRNKLNHVVRSAKKKFYADEMAKNGNNMKALWSTIKQILNKRKT